MQTKVKVDIAKFRAALKREMEAFKKEGIRRFPKVDRIGIGDDLIEEMKGLIAKGISPIQGYGRFPAYKAVAKSNEYKKARAGIFKGDNDRYTRAVRKQIKAKADRIKKRGYPYTVMGKFPDKRPRPVNLRLSGDFLDVHLESRAPKTGGLSVGFWDSKAVSMEQGHREGANGQGVRPIIPQGNETFTRVIYQRLLTSARYRLIHWYEIFAAGRK